MKNLRITSFLLFPLWLTMFLFPVNVAAQNNYDIGVTSITTSSRACVANLDTLWVDIENYGNLPIDSFKVVWNINGALDSSWFITPILTGSNNSVHLQLDTFSLDTGMNQITITTSLPNNNQDQNTLNDTMSYTTQEELPQIVFLDHCMDYFTVILILHSENTEYTFWDFGDGSYDTTTTDTAYHIYPWSTQDSLFYSVNATLYNSCNSSVDTSLVVRANYNLGGSPCFVSTKEHTSSKTINVYPNPAHRVLNIDLGKNYGFPSSLSLYNTKGNLVYFNSQLKSTPAHEIDVSNLPKGLYLLRIANGKQSETKKIIIN